MNKQLVNQLREHFGGIEHVPPHCLEFLNSVSETYNRFGSGLYESEASLRNMLHNTDTAYVLLDHNATILSVNPAAAALGRQVFRQIPETGMNYLELIDENRRLKMKWMIADVISNAQPLKYEVQYDAADRSEKWLEVRICPIVRDKAVTGVSVAATDITEYKKQISKLVKQDEQIREFSYTTSHELRHEASKSRMLVEGMKVRLLIEGAKIPPSIRSDFDQLILKLEDSSNHMNNIIHKMNDLLKNYSGVSGGQPISLSQADEICFVDDDPLINAMNRKLIDYLIPDANVRIFEEMDQALSHIDAARGMNRYVFLDLNLRGRSGWDFLEGLRKLGGGKNTSVIVLTSSIDPVDYERSKSYPEVRLFQIKPLTLQVLKILK